MSKLFDLEMILPYDIKKPVTERVAARAVIIKDNKLLMVKSKHHDLKFPGGGVEDRETMINALTREVKEETGYLIKVSNLLGTIVQLGPDIYDDSKSFKMTSNYYLSEVIENLGSLDLSGYEIDLDMKPIWIDLDRAININENLDIKLDWVDRELLALKEVRKHRLQLNI